MPLYEIDQVKQAAANRWPEIFSAISGAQELSFDGKHGPCPKCGGTDRFRLIDPAAGACLCNQCFTSKNGDGLAVLQWLTDQGFSEVLAATAGYLGITPVKQKRNLDPAKDLQFLPWAKILAKIWCRKKQPVTPEALEAIGARLAKYRDEYNVVAIPVWGPSLRQADAVGWVLYRLDGGKLPKYRKGSREPEWTKVKITAGSQKGVIFSANAFDQETKTIWKCEGAPDLLALISKDSTANGFTTANGAKETPADWLVELCRDRNVNVVHDCDEPGQQGATEIPGRDGITRPGWCPALAAVATEVRNVVLPYDITPTDGPDLRDYFVGGGTFESLVARAEKAQLWEHQDRPAKAIISESIDNPSRLARINLTSYQAEHGGRLVYWREEWWRYKSGRYTRIQLSDLRAKVWSAVQAEFERCWLEKDLTDGKEEHVRKVSRTLINNVVGAMESICSISSSIELGTWISDRSMPHYVSMKNGILNLNAIFENQPPFLIPHSDQWFSGVKLEYEFDPRAKCETWLKFLHDAMEGDKDRLAILQEWAGYLLTRENKMQRFMVLEGEGGNGKTCYFAGVTAMLGQENVSYVALENFGSRFDLSMTIGKAANICGDVGEIDNLAEGSLKNYTGGGVMNFDRKNQKPLECRPTAKLMASWNKRPLIRDKTRGVWRRLILIPFNHEVSKSERVFGMDTVEFWESESSGILNWAIEGLARLRQQGEFTESKIMDEAIHEFRSDNDPTIEFFEEYISPGEGYVEATRFYELYCYWCRKSGYRPMSSRNFGKQVKRAFKNVEKVRKRNGANRVYLYEGIEYATEEILSESVEDPSSFF